MQNKLLYFFFVNWWNFQSKWKSMGMRGNLFNFCVTVYLCEINYFKQVSGKVCLTLKSELIKLIKVEECLLNLNCTHEYLLLLLCCHIFRKIWHFPPYISHPPYNLHRWSLILNFCRNLHTSTVIQERNMVIENTAYFRIYCIITC